MGISARMQCGCVPGVHVHNLSLERKGMAENTVDLRTLLASLVEAVLGKLGLSGVLERVGDEIRGTCPMHSAGSFTAHVRTGALHCFCYGHKRPSNLVELVVTRMNMTYEQALEEFFMPVCMERVQESSAAQLTELEQKDLCAEVISSLCIGTRS